MSNRLTISSTINMSYMEDGEDVLQAVTDNQHDSFALDSKGNALAAQQRSTNVRLWLGSEQQTISSVVATLSYVGGGNVPSGVTVGYNITTDSGAATGNVALVYVNLYKNTMLTDDLKCTIIVTCAEGSRTVIFSLSRVMSGADGKTPVRWQLLLSQTQLAFQRTRGGFTPAQQVVGIQVQRDDGNGIVNMGLEEAFRQYNMAVCAATGEPPSSYSSSQQIDRDITVSETDVGLGVAAIGLSLFDIASSTTSLHDKQSLTIVKDGADGNEGAPGKSFRRIYKSTNSSTAPSTPTGSSPSGWSTTPTTVSSSARYRYMSEGSSSDGGTTWGNWSSPVLDMYLPEDGTSISIKGRSIGATTQECENAPLDAMCHYILSPQVDESIVVYGDVVLCNGSQTYDKVQYVDNPGVFRSVPDSSTGDCYIDLDGHLWQRNSASTGVRWVDVGQIKGEKGEDAVMYQIRIVTSSVSVNPNGIIDGDLSWNVVKYVGATSSLVSYNTGLHQYRYIGNGWEGDWANAGDDSANTLDFDDAGVGEKWSAYPSASQNKATHVELRFSIGGNVMATLTVPINIVGQMSRNLFYGGEWNLTGTFTVTDYKAPYFRKVDGSTVTYWAWVGESGTYQKSSNVPSADSVNWRQMTDEFDFLITKAVFTDFAMLGSAVFNGDFMFSQHGDMMGYGMTKTRITDGSMYANVDPTNMFGTTFVDYYSGKARQGTAISGTNWRTYSGYYLQGLVKGTTFTLESGKWYSIKVYGGGVNFMVNNLSTTTGALVNGSTGDGFATKCVNFFCATGGSYSVFLSAAVSGVNGTMYECQIAECVFVPTLTMNLRTGESRMSRLLLYGRLMKERTTITADHYEEYTSEVTLTRNGVSTTVRYLDPFKCSDFIVIRSLPSGVNLALPSLVESNPVFNETVRQMIGTDLVVYNETGAKIKFGTWQSFYQQLMSTWIFAGCCVHFRLVMEQVTENDTTYENYKWEWVSGDGGTKSLWLL